MDEEVVQLETPDAGDLQAEMADDPEVIAGKKKDGDENGIIAILIG
ncbi:MAG: hypothetical protein AB7P40_12540 [Chloroflexota bacterium]